MVKKKLICLFFLGIYFFSSYTLANPNVDQWLDTDMTYKDLIDDGFEVKSYSISDIQTSNGLMLLLFVTVLQKEKEIYECQEYHPALRKADSISYCASYGDVLHQSEH